MKVLFLVNLFISIVYAHFTLDYPPTIGFDEDQEPNPPCGGFPPDLSNLTEWPLVGGEIAIDLHHPEALFLFRTQLAGSDSWVNVSDGFVSMVGLGEGCIRALAVPQNWSGLPGVLQVIGQPPDGILYQCAGVKFTPGVPGTSSFCVNGSGITLTDTSQSFPVSNLTVDFTGSLTNSSTTSSASSSSTAKSGAGTVHDDYGMVLIVGFLMGVLALLGSSVPLM